LEIQARIPAALAAIHNYICAHSDADDDNPLKMNGGDTVNASHDNSNDLEEDGPIFDHDDDDERRDQIARAMWDDYQKVCEERRNVGTDGSAESDSDDDDSDELDAAL
jgi:hypothetical protein